MTFTKLRANPYLTRITSDFTNHFSVICRFNNALAKKKAIVLLLKINILL